MKLGYEPKNTPKYSKFALKIRTGYEQFEAESGKKIRTAEPQQKFTGSYKKRVYTQTERCKNLRFLTVQSCVKLRCLARSEALNQKLDVRDPKVFKISANQRKN